MNNNLRSDRTWNGGCESVTRTGKRIGKLCNARFYRTKTVNGIKIKCCYNHCDGSYQDAENEGSFCDDGSDDEIHESDFSFIAPEDDGTLIVNGAVYHDNYELSVIDNEETETESESEYVPETESESEIQMEGQYQDVYKTEPEDESEYVPEAESEIQMEGQYQDVYEVETEPEDEYYIKYIKEKEKSKNLEVLLSQERQKLDEYKKIFEKNMNDEQEGFTQVVEDADAHNEETFGKEESELDVVKSKLEKLENAVHDLSKFIRDIFSSAEKYSL